MIAVSALGASPIGLLGVSILTVAGGYQLLRENRPKEKRGIFFIVFYVSRFFQLFVLNFSYGYGI